MPSKPHIPYLNMGPYPCFLGFTMSPKAFRRELKRLDVGETEFLGRSNANATTHVLEHPKRETCFIIALRKPKEASVEQVAALVAQEARVRADPNLRADRFVERWQQLSQDRDRLYRAGDMAGREKASKEMAGMAKSLVRDPQVESILRGRSRELGLEIGMSPSRDLGRELSRDLGISHDRGMSR